MSSFTPRAWKSQQSAEAKHRGEPPAGKFHAHHLVKFNNLPLAPNAFILATAQGVRIVATSRQALTIARRRGPSRWPGFRPANANRLFQRARVHRVDSRRCSRGARVFRAGAGGPEALGNELGTADALGNMAELEFRDGYPEQALRAASEALEIYLRGKSVNVARFHSNSAAYRIVLGDLTGARDSAREGARRTTLHDCAPIISPSLSALVATHDAMQIGPSRKH